MTLKYQLQTGINLSVLKVMHTMGLGANYSKIQASKEITNYHETFALNDASLSGRI